jgi:secondary thiamine-phosphate synthase enzyme
MGVKTVEINVHVGADSKMEKITGQIGEIVRDSDLVEGSVNIFVPGATGSISTVEYEPGLREDVPEALERLAPEDIPYKHHQTWNDDNGRSHVRATIMGPGTMVPFVGSKLKLGKWQDVVIINHDTRARNREIIVQLMGE